jgi:hypothetical protein
MPVTELSAKLADLRPIPPLGIRRIEAGDRRVDVDDLVAIALALGVSPSTLLVPKTETVDDPVAVTGVKGGVRVGRLWGWLTAEHPLTGDTADSVIGFLYRAIPSWLFGARIDVVESGTKPTRKLTIRRYDSDQVFDGEHSDGND